MTIQTINQGTAPSGAGGDTSRSAMTKINANFTDNTNAASRLVGTGSGNVMEVGAFGWGGYGATIVPTSNLNFIQSIYGKSQIARRSDGTAPDVPNYSAGLFIQTFNTYMYLCAGFTGSGIKILTGAGTTDEPTVYTIYTDKNTTVDSNGFIKKASPIIKLYADKVESNEQASTQNPIFEKVATGHYLIKQTEGFANDGWYIEMPKDANGNVLVAVVYNQMSDNTLQIKTYAKKLDLETGDVIPNLDKPVEIPVDRWIDLRLKELQKEVINEPQQ